MEGWRLQGPQCYSSFICPCRSDAQLDWLSRGRHGRGRGLRRWVMDISCSVDRKTAFSSVRPHPAVSRSIGAYASDELFWSVRTRSIGVTKKTRGRCECFLIGLIRTRIQLSSDLPLTEAVGWSTRRRTTTGMESHGGGDHLSLVVGDPAVILEFLLSPSLLSVTMSLAAMPCQFVPTYEMFSVTRPRETDRGRQYIFATATFDRSERSEGARSWHRVVGRPDGMRSLANFNARTQSEKKRGRIESGGGGEDRVRGRGSVAICGLLFVVRRKVCIPQQKSPCINARPRGPVRMYVHWSCTWERILSFLLLVTNYARLRKVYVP